MSCDFINFMALSITVAKDLKNPVLETLLSDYAKSRTENKLQFFLVHLLANNHSKKLKPEYKMTYGVIKYYFMKNKTNVTRQLLYDDFSMY